MNLKHKLAYQRLWHGDLEALDQRVREQLLAHPLELRPCGRGVGRFELEVDDATNARLVHREPERSQ